jgi:predicted RNA-binding Zn ribbon-like protein
MDLVNTLRERWSRKVETLVSQQDLSDWLVHTGVLSEPQAITSPVVLNEARRLREAIDSSISAVLEGRALDPAAVSVIDKMLVYAGTRPQLSLAPDGAPEIGERPASDSPRRALGTIALDAAEMLGDPKQRARIRICASETCSARFYDRSPAGARVWCSMSTCGNTAKARRHRARQKELA